MTIFNKRNALVGFITLKALERRRGRSQLRRRAPKIALFGLVSLGLVAAIVAVFVRRQRSEAERFDPLTAEDESEIVGEYVSTGPDPIPAT